jgi:NAD(P)-dependent dehydrogenase (short-subunit alcohol dehydrogenase family)
MSDLSGRVALVTGGSSGLGRAVAVALAGAGADVALVARGSGDLERTADEVRAIGRSAVSVVVDLAEPGEITRAVDRVRAELGGVGILVNAAGTDVPGGVEELSAADWDRVLNVNLRATFLLSQAVFPDMRQHGGGLIINIGSVAGRRGWANVAAYCSSKFALTGLTQVLNAEGRRHRIRACLLYPGAMDTNWGVFEPEQRDATSKGLPTAQAMPAEHVAKLITWIAAAPPDLVMNEATVTPLLEAGWP